MRQPWDTGDDWRRRWVQSIKKPVLHRLSDDAVENVEGQDNDFAGVNFRGTTMCGRKSPHWFMPGIFSRMDAPRCKQCCRILGLSEGNGCPANYNIEEP